MRHGESRIQQACVKWFDYEYTEIRKLLFAVPNGGYRSGLEAKIMHGEGVRAGVSDMILLVARKNYNSLCIEFKASDKSVQTDNQKEWQKLVEAHGSKYIVCRSFDEFRTEMENYLND